MTQHTLLSRQLSRRLNLPEGGSLQAWVHDLPHEQIKAHLQAFIAAVDETYQHFERDLHLAGRNLEMCAAELLMTRQRLREHEQQQERAFKQPQQAVEPAVSTLQRPPPERAQLAERCGVPAGARACGT